MSTQEKDQISVQNNYEVRRTGFNRLSIIVDSDETPVVNPRLFLIGDDAILERNGDFRVILPEFPQEYILELLPGHSVLIGEREDAGGFANMESMMFSSPNIPVRRFYEAMVCTDSEMHPLTKVRHMDVVLAEAANA